jgi:hypothetical protein
MNVDELFTLHFRGDEPRDARKRRRSCEWRQGRYKDRVRHFLRQGYTKAESMKRAGENQ